MIRGPRAAVPEEDTFDPLFGKSSVPRPLYMGLLTQSVAAHGAVAVGIAQHAVDDITAIATGQKAALLYPREYGRGPRSFSIVWGMRRRRYARSAALRLRPKRFGPLWCQGEPEQPEHCKMRARLRG